MRDKYFLSKGSHPIADAGRCAMEWVSYLAGEPHSDSPRCVGPVLTTFCIRLNDALDDEKRQKLRPYLARTIGTRGDGLDEQRAWMCTDWLVRTYTPTWLALAGLNEAAERLRALPLLLAVENAQRAMDDLNAAKREAAVVRAAAGAAAVAAAVAAAWDAAVAAARDALAPTTAALQESAFELLDRMLPTEVIQLPVVEDAALVCGVQVA